MHRTYLPAEGFKVDGDIAYVELVPNVFTTDSRGSMSSKLGFFLPESESGVASQGRLWLSVLNFNRMLGYFVIQNQPHFLDGMVLRAAHIDESGTARQLPIARVGEAASLSVWKSEQQYVDHRGAVNVQQHPTSLDFRDSRVRLNPMSDPAFAEFAARTIADLRPILKSVVEEHNQGKFKSDPRVID
jgi:hypothetical protein